METFFAVMEGVYKLFARKMNVWGFYFSFWDVIIFGLLAALAFGFVRRIFYDS